MTSKVKISASIVLHNEPLHILKETINSFLSISFSKKLFLIDNSLDKNPTLSNLSEETEYIYNDKNLGFGKAHNIILNQLNSFSEYHLILNPDVTFNPQIINELIKQLEADVNLSMISPKVLYPNGKTQLVCRKNPTIKELISRRLHINQNYVKQHQYLNTNLNTPFNPQFIHGCFMLFKTDDFINLSGFDERYFLYMEDADICRKIYVSNKKVLYYPKVSIKHIHRKASAKKIKLLFYHIASAIKYFKKWGIS